MQRRYNLRQRKPKKRRRPAKETSKQEAIQLALKKGGPPQA